MEKWIGECIALMHVNGIKQEAVASEMGIRREYLNKILNGKEAPKGAEERITEAINNIIARQE